MMLQYDEAKKACGDSLLLFRMGDFYELFYDDAVVTSKTLGLTLTSRDKGENAIPMTGFPYHQLDGYMAKLIKQGFRVAVCEQVENKKQTKGLVRREIQQIVSPGTVTDLSLLDPAESNFLAAVISGNSGRKRKQKSGNLQLGIVGVSWIDLSTGRFVVTQIHEAGLGDLLSRLSVKEVLCTDDMRETIENQFPGTMLTTRPDWSFAVDLAYEGLKKQLDVGTLEGFGLDDTDATAVRAAGGILEYLKESQQGSLDHVNHLFKYCPTDFVEIDLATWRSLEVSRTIRTGTRDGSLFDVIDCCVTPMGSRQLGAWLRSPLTSIEKIRQRHDALEEFLLKRDRRKNLRDQLKEIYDLERLVARVATGRAAPRDLLAICKTLKKLPEVKQALSGVSTSWLKQLFEDLDECKDLTLELDRALCDPCPPNLRDGGFLQDGYNKTLDQYRELANGGKKWIAEYQQTVCETTGIPSIKVGFNKVFGYYLEVTNSHKEKVPENFIRKQTLKNAERYITPELKAYEEKVISADENAIELELELFQQLREQVRSNTTRLKANAAIIATLDVVVSLAELAARQQYCRPEMTDDQSLIIADGRHPVLDIIEPLGAFIPNDTTIDDDRGFLHLITGPNMAGKSTYIRQVALITLMAQIGSFVPAKTAKVGVVDRIFARVGASDELTRGQSTFMVEMTETARILNTASDRSLVILDEIGRGTSTYDGVSLAWSIVEYIHDHIGCRTLFATHYHELTELEERLAGVRNYNVAVQEWEEKIVFLHKIIPGGADKSYGIHVAKLAGVPQWVNDRAKEILERLENGNGSERPGQNDTEANRRILNAQTKRSTEIQLTLFETGPHPLVEILEKTEVDNLTPIESLKLIDQWKEEYAGQDKTTKVKASTTKPANSGTES